MALGEGAADGEGTTVATSDRAKGEYDLDTVRSESATRETNDSEAQVRTRKRRRHGRSSKTVLLDLRRGGHSGEGGGELSATGRRGREDCERL